MPVAPTLNLFCNIWKQWNLGGPAPLVAPTYANVLCNLQYGRKEHVPVQPVANYPVQYLLVGKGTDLQDSDVNFPAILDLVECPAGSKRWYVVEYVEDQAKGFPTETRVAILIKAYIPYPGQPTYKWPVPYP
jgi:hypothetical protein